MKLRNTGSVLLLLVLLHVQLPEQFLVMLHAHEHTEDQHQAGVWIENPHEHCPSGFQFWLSGSLPASEIPFETLPFIQKYGVAKTAKTYSHRKAQLCLRGPPVWDVV